VADQLGLPCDKHPSPLTCFCDEDRDREAGIHRASGLDNGFGGYKCVCGAPTPAFCPKPTGKPRRL
jgi:hypothetical protein